MVTLPGRPGRATTSSSRPTASGGASAKFASLTSGQSFYVVNNTVRRIRAVDPNGQWIRDGSYANIPLMRPMDTQQQIDAQFPTLGPTHRIRLDAERAHVRGKIREYLPL